MNITLRKRALHFLNQMEVIEENGGEDAYMIVENNEENRQLLQEAGIPLETALKYGDDNSFCVLALAFSERYADLYDGDKLVAFEKSFHIDFKDDRFITFYKDDNKYFIMVSQDNGESSSIELADDQLQEIKNIIEC